MWDFLSLGAFKCRQAAASSPWQQGINKLCLAQLDGLPSEKENIAPNCVGDAKDGFAGFVCLPEPAAQNLAALSHVALGALRPTLMCGCSAFASNKTLSSARRLKFK